MKKMSFLLVLFLCMQLQAQDEMLCRGYYWTEDEGNLKLKEFASEWDDVESWEQRARLIRQGIIDGLRLEEMPEISGNFNPIIRNTREMDGYIVENIAIESFPGFYITGNLYRPKEKQDSYPAILSPHGHWPERRFSVEVQLRCAFLASMGAIVFTYDMVGYGESTQVDHDIPIVLLLQTWNSRRVLDYLLSRDDVDPERIAMTGASGGATQTFVFSAIDDRIKFAVPAVQISAHFFGGCNCESGMPIHKSGNHQTNNVEIAATFAPKPMLMISDGADYTRNTPRVEYPYIKNVYALYDAEHKVENVHFPTESHDYGYRKRSAMYNFLAHHMKMNLYERPYKDGYIEDFIRILEKDELRVFNEGNPRPANALGGNKAVMRYLEMD